LVEDALPLVRGQLIEDIGGYDGASTIQARKPIDITLTG
jgi:hypothetical protein